MAKSKMKPGGLTSFWRDQNRGSTSNATGEYVRFTSKSMRERDAETLDKRDWRLTRGWAFEVLMRFSGSYIGAWSLPSNGIQLCMICDGVVCDRLFCTPLPTSESSLHLLHPEVVLDVPVVWSARPILRPPSGARQLTGALRVRVRVSSPTGADWPVKLSEL